MTKQSLPVEWFPRQFTSFKIARWHARDLRKRGYVAHVWAVVATGFHEVRISRGNKDE